MQFNKFTTNSKEALQDAHTLAQKSDQQQVDALHLLVALINQPESITVSMLERLKIPIDDLRARAEEEIGNTPPVMGQVPFGQIYLTQELGNVLSRASEEAENLNDEFISVEHLFLALIDVDSRAKLVLQEVASQTGDIAEADAEQLLDYNNILKTLKDIRGSARVTDPEPESSYQALESYGQNLTKMAREEKLDPIIGREDTIRRLMQVISRRKKNNPVLIGEAGVGKTAIAEGLAQRIASGDVPESLKDRELISLDLGAVISGTRFRGEFEKRINAILREIKDSNGKIILFIDELHTLVGAGQAEGAMDASNLLKPALARGELSAIGATTLKEYQKHIEKDPALERRFQPVFVSEPSVDDTVAILRGIKDKYEVHHGVRIADSALVEAADLSHRYIADRFLPDKAVDLIDEAASAMRMEIDSMPEELDDLTRQLTKLEIEKRALEKEKTDENKERLKELKKDVAELSEKSNQLQARWKHEKEIITKIQDLKKELEKLKSEAEIAERRSDLQRVAEIKYSKIPNTQSQFTEYEKELTKIQKKNPILKKEVSHEDIARVVARWTGIPVEKMLEEEKEKLARMENELSKKVVGQTRAIEVISNAIRRSRTGINPPNRPIGVFLFVGPTGVGKTELVKSLADFMFNDPAAMIRVDMSEFGERHTTARLIGSPPGYVGHDEGGQLTEKVRRRPYSVILFDEIEKAHPEVFNVFLQIFDDGHLTDSKGRKVNFKNTIIVMTSNIGNEVIRDFVPIGFGTEKGADTKSYPEMKEKVMDAITKFFKPELLNRFDESVVFDYLTPKDLEKIVEIELAKVEDHLADKKIKLFISKEVKAKLIEMGYKPEFGARPLKRVIQREVLDRVAMSILRGKVKEGDKLSVSLIEDSIEIVSRKKRTAKKKTSEDAEVSA